MSDNMTDKLIWEKIQHKVGHFSSDFEKKNSNIMYVLCHAYPTCDPLSF